ncbi:MAG TPA: biotin--[acetyl-CoA-carboxylase] ligase [Rubricoccaceae bacterium]|jgi:BirA family biotin operon repressor/biotin-[acetyl-CoA-carboxylase] ligase
MPTLPSSLPALPHPAARRPLGHPARHLADVGSTMAEAAAWADAPHGALVVAETQSAGRGRHGRVWQDEPGASLLLSIVLRPRLAPERLGLVGLAAGLALAETAEAFGATAALKWPNDVLAAGPDRRLAKLAGVLAEASWAGAVPRVVLGAGLNVRQRAFPDDLAGTSLRIATGRDIERLAPLGPFLDAFAIRLDDAERAPASFLAAVEARLVGIGEPCTVAFPGTDRPALAGTAAGLAPDGALRVATPLGEQTVHAGEVTLAR